MSRMTLHVSAIAGAVFLWVLPWARARSEEAAQPSVLERFEVFGDGDELLVPVTVRGKEYTFCVDTGCAKTVYDVSLAEELKAASDTVRLGSLRIDVGTAPFTYDLALFRKVSGYDLRGVLGMDFLAKYVIRIDSDSGRLLFLDAAGIEDGQRLRIAYRYDGLPVVFAEVVGLDRRPFLVDTGCVGFGTGCLYSGLLQDALNAGAATPLGTKPSVRMAENSTVKDVGGAVAFVNEIALAGFRHSQMEFGDHARANILGMGYWSRYSVMFDFPNAVMYLKPSKRFNVADKRGNSGLHLLRIDGETVAETVDDESPASAAGIRSGDVLVSIGGLDCDKTRLYVLRRALSEAEKTVNLVVRRDAKVFRVSLVLEKHGASTQRGIR